MAEAVADREYVQIERFWRDKYRLADSSQFSAQAEIVFQHLKRVVPAGAFYRNVLELGSGRGRMLPYLNSIGGHVHAADLFDALENDVESKIPNVTYVKLRYPPALPVKNGFYDFVLACHTFQHVVSEQALRLLLAEVKRAAKPGAKLVIFDNAVDRAPHIKFRSPDLFTQALELVNVRTERLSINKPNDHWLIDGTFK